MKSDALKLKTGLFENQAKHLNTYSYEKHSKMLTCCMDKNIKYDVYLLCTLWL